MISKPWCGVWYQKLSAAWYGVRKRTVSCVPWVWSGKRRMNKRAQLVPNIVLKRASRVGILRKILSSLPLWNFCFWKHYLSLGSMHVCWAGGYINLQRLFVGDWGEEEPQASTVVLLVSVEDSTPRIPSGGQQWRRPWEAKSHWKRSM